MKIIPTDIPDVKIIEPALFGDERGYFMESYSQAAFEREVCRTVFVQDNESRSRYGVVRGLHFSCRPAARANWCGWSRGASAMWRLTCGRGRLRSDGMWR